jgi:hypothetical protein
VQHHDLVMVVDPLGIPIDGQQRREGGVGRAYVGGDGDEPRALRYAVVMAVDGQRRLAQGREGQNGGARLRADAGNALEPRPRLGDGGIGEEIEGERALPRGDRAQHRLDARRLLLRPRHAGDGCLDVGGRRVADGCPIGIARLQGLEGTP